MSRVTDMSVSHEARMVELLQRAREPQAAHVFTRLYEEAALATARWADAQQRAGVHLGPLAGQPVSIKDLYDVAGETTLAGSVVREGEPVAQADAPAVARLRAAGAALIGKTNMTEFAYSGVGINPHRGTPVNPADGQVARIPGGSSSGAAVSVALGLAVAGLGSDTGGSIRVPAALCGLVGFKSTQSRVPTAGAFPLSHTLDTVCAMTRSVRDCLRVDAVLSGAALPVVTRPVKGLRLVVPQTVVLDAMEPAVARAFERALSTLSAAGAELVELPMLELAQVSDINGPVVGGFSAVESWTTLREVMRTQRHRMDPRVAARVAPGEQASAADYLDMHRRRQGWIARVTHVLAPFDALLCPTVPLVAPPIEALRDHDEAFFRANGLLLRNTFLINLLDGCAFSLPCHAPDELPVGLMLAAPGGQDAHLGTVALAVEAALQSVRA